MNESTMQAIMMRWVMDWKQHQLAVPNIKSIYPWEADLISATKAWLTHEYEIKVSRADFLADKNKKSKHRDLACQFGNTERQPLTEVEGKFMEWGIRSKQPQTPNYFWYVTNGFEIEESELPPYAGWIRVGVETSTHWWNTVIVEREAPRLHSDKLSEKNREGINRWLSYKLKNMYLHRYVRKIVTQQEEPNA